MMMCLNLVNYIVISLIESLKLEFQWIISAMMGLVIISEPLITGVMLKDFQFLTLLGMAIFGCHQRLTE